VPQPPQLSAVIVYEPEAAARDRLTTYGYSPEVAAEIAVYLAQATDLLAIRGELDAALRGEGIDADFVALDDLPDRVAALRREADRTILWCQTDGIRYYRGSAVPALARLVGVARYGAPPFAQHLCQDKFAATSLAAAVGLPVPPTLLLEGHETIGACGTADWDTATLFVKPTTLGAKIGIFADSRCRGLAAARDLSQRIFDRYGDRAVVQPFIAGDDIRVSYMHAGGAFAAELGIARLERDPRGEAGGDFMTMRDNDTLSGARDTAGGRGGFGAAREAAFVPTMGDLKRTPDAARTVVAITGAAARLARVLRLDDYFSMDFRLDGDGRPHFLEFEVCPAVTIYDFAEYLRGTHGLGLGVALARSMRLAHARQHAKAEA
jgi:hypothetical protein